MCKKLTDLFLPVIIIFVSIISFIGCSSEDNSVDPPATGEVLLAEVSGDSVGVSSGSSSMSQSITGSTLNFSDRDSVRLTFYYSGENNFDPAPLKIFYNQGPAEINIFNFSSANITPTEKYIDTTIASPKVNDFFIYRITASSPTFSFFKFRDLKIYKK
ncbi:MAG TPA: hypothetical protein PK294_01585 [Ignavibacteria bacterium]|nr:hypothetical protein [Ignavibacteria bacterium]HQY51633.1 hypothetical protein [Ignavibacteria bacterium]HRA99105.1 hypothetical protein [Ignavibacteria bacterium]